MAAATLGVLVTTAAPAAVADPSRPGGDCALKAPGAPTLAAAPWAQTQLKFDQAWSTTRGRDARGTAVTVAVIDSGFSPALNAARPSGQMKQLAAQVLPGHNVVGATEPFPGYILDCGGPEAERGHGTRVASLIAAPQGPYAFVGVAPQVDILPIKAVGNDAVSVEPDAVARGIRYAVAAHAGVINISIDFPTKQSGAGASTDDFPALRSAVIAAQRAGVVIVAAAGNIQTGTDPRQGDVLRYPAGYAGDSCCGNVISVGSMSKDGSVSTFSVTRSNTIVLAPGDDITALQAGGGYAVDSGTSYAAPLVAWVVALMRAAHPDWTPEQIRGQLERTAQGARGTVPDPAYGYGVVSPVLAVTTPLVGPTSTAPTASGRGLPAPRAAAGADHPARNRSVAVAVGLAGLAVLCAIGAAVWRRTRA